MQFNRTISARKQITVPKEIVKHYDIKEGDLLTFEFVKVHKK